MENGLASTRKLTFQKTHISELMSKLSQKGSQKSPPGCRKNEFVVPQMQPWAPQGPLGDPRRVQRTNQRTPWRPKGSKGLPMDSQMSPQGPPNDKRDPQKWPGVDTEAHFSKKHMFLDVYENCFKKAPQRAPLRNVQINIWLPKCCHGHPKVIWVIPRSSKGQTRGPRGVQKGPKDPQWTPK